MPERPDGDWLPICRSEDLTQEKPTALQLGDAVIAAYREPSGAVRALEDRCPHRRAPLSLGRITSEGKLQCGYHGWTFDGGAGLCVAIPNLTAEERVPERYRATAYRVAERDGFVYLWTGASEANIPAPPPGLATVTDSGAHVLSIAHNEFIAALLDDPNLVLSLPFVRITDCDISDGKLENDALLVERAAIWANPQDKQQFIGVFPLRLLTATHIRTATTRLELRDAGNAVLIEAILTATPVGRGATAVRWRSRFHGGGADWQAKVLAGLVGLGAAPVKIRSAIDGAALTRTLTGPSRQWRETVLEHSAKAA